MNGIVNVVLRHKVLAVMMLVAGLAMVGNLVAMQVTEEVNWSAFDFAALTVFLLVVGVVLEVATGAFRTGAGKLAIGAAVVGAAAIVFIELAVGIVGSPIAGS